MITHATKTLIKRGEEKSSSFRKWENKKTLLRERDRAKNDESGERDGKW
jgi:hypothetical protein